MNRPQTLQEANEQMLKGLRHRRDRIQELLGIQDHEDARTLLSAEMFYVKEQIEYREKHGGTHKIILEKP